MKREKPVFSKNLFWDVDINEVDIDAYPAQVVVRVLERGSIEDWKALKSYYSISEIKDAAINARSLEPTAMSFAAAVTCTPIEEFRCYKLLQSNPELSFY